jgi:dTDP-D-glucose 4,6-dehydratase
LLGWTAKTKLDDGLKRTVNFYKNNKQWWEKFLWMKELWGQR